MPGAARGAPPTTPPPRPPPPHEREALAPLDEPALDLAHRFLGLPRALRRRGRAWSRLEEAALPRLFPGATLIAQGACHPCPCSFGACWCRGRCPCRDQRPPEDALRGLADLLRRHRGLARLLRCPGLLALPGAGGVPLRGNRAFRLLARHAPLAHQRMQAWTRAGGCARTAQERTERLLLRRLVTAESVQCRHRALAAAGVPAAARAGAIQAGLLRSKAYWDEERLPFLVAVYERRFRGLLEASQQPQRFPKAREVDRTRRARNLRMKKVRPAAGRQK